MRTKLLLFILLFVTGSYFGQNTRETAKRIEIKKTYEQVQVKSLPAEESSFYGYDSKIKEILLKEASLDFVPKRKENQTKNEYLNTLNEWIKSNSLLVKPDQRSTEIN